MARDRHRRDSGLQASSASGMGEGEYGYPLSDADPEASVQQGGGGWPGGIPPDVSLEGTGALDGITDGGLGFIGGWGGGHA